MRMHASLLTESLWPPQLKLCEESHLQGFCVVLPAGFGFALYCMQ